MGAATPLPAAVPERLVSLDAFRGLTVAAMVLVNNPGSWSAVYWPLDHAAWHGWTPTDLIFPFFLFIVGVAMNFSRRSSLAEIARRSVTIAALGLLMAAYPFYTMDPATFRFPGVLQRIALCYLAASLARRVFPTVAGQVALTSFLLVFYWLLMTRVPVPGGGLPNLDPETNLAAHVDRMVLGPHMWKQTRTWDPEGVLSTVPAVASTLLGLLAGAWLKTARPPRAKAIGLCIAGATVAIAGVLWSDSFPINKNLWTSSYVLFTGGLAASLLALCYFVADVCGYRGWTKPAVVYGRNAITVFVASGILAKTLGLIKFAGADGVSRSLQSHLYRALFASWASPYNASLAFAIANVVGWYAVLLVLDRRGLYLKV